MKRVTKTCRVCKLTETHDGHDLCWSCRHPHRSAENYGRRHNPPGHAERIEAHRLRVEEESPRPWKETT